MYQVHGGGDYSVERPDFLGSRGLIFLPYSNFTFNWEEITMAKLHLSWFFVHLVFTPI